jgi:hypothetical protein
MREREEPLTPNPSPRGERGEEALTPTSLPGERGAGEVAHQKKQPRFNQARGYEEKK